jgi:acyl-CoA reductase-like NAD-dependent aldehyde dehydrogenase
MKYLWRCKSFNTILHGSQLNLSKDISSRKETQKKNITFTAHAPVGVIVAILSYEASIVDIALAIAPALMSGNCVILKASEKCPLAVMRFSKVLDKVPLLPMGAVNVLSGSGVEVGAYLTRHSDVAKVREVSISPFIRV